MIDALNEGAGRSIWPKHISAFLELVTRSPWISVVVSVRSNYEELVLPSAVSKSAARVTHQGFADHEYDASKTFFKHYGIELPLTPLLAPEYRSPLFLKSICVGLKDAGHTRLPRGFHGISQVFRLYTDAINRRLAQSLDFDPRSQLVHRALNKFVAAFPSHRTQWLPREDAVALVDAILPNRTFQNSLYQALVSEGLLVEDFIRVRDDDEKEFVHLGYERLADHLTAESIIEAAQQRKVAGTSPHPSLTNERQSPKFRRTRITVHPSTGDFEAGIDGLRSLNPVALAMGIVVSVPAGTEIYVIFEKSQQANAAGAEKTGHVPHLDNTALDSSTPAQP